MAKQKYKPKGVSGMQVVKEAFDINPDDQRPIDTSDVNRFLAAETEEDFESLALDYALGGSAFGLEPVLFDGAPGMATREHGDTASSARNMKTLLQAAMKLLLACERLRISDADLSSLGVSIVNYAEIDWLDIPPHPGTAPEPDGLRSPLRNIEREGSCPQAPLDLASVYVMELHLEPDANSIDFLLEGYEALGGNLVDQSRTLILYDEPENGLRLLVRSEHFLSVGDSSKSKSRRRGCESLLDALTMLMLHDARPHIKDGKFSLLCASVASSLWVSALEGTEGDRVRECAICGNVMKVGNERGNKKDTCGNRCRSKKYKCEKVLKRVKDGEDLAEAAKDLEISLLDVQRYRARKAERERRESAVNSLEGLQEVQDEG